MIRVNVNEEFSITVTLLDEETNQPASGQDVYYDVREQPGDSALSPTLDGILTESTVEPGIYKEMVSISEAGTYVVYATCVGFLANTEDITVNEEDIYEVVKQSRHYNISVEDVLRTTSVPTADQVTRSVPENKTDYVITKIKRDQDADWSGAYVVEGIVYAWYKASTDNAPYRMGGPN